MRAAIDSAANRSFARAELLPWEANSTASVEIDLALNTTTCRSTKETEVEILCGEIKLKTKLLLVPKLREEIILGHDWLKEQQAVLDYNRGCIHLGRDQRHTIFWHDRPELDSPAIDWTAAISSTPPEVREKLQGVLQRHHEVFAGQQLKGTRSIKHEIRLKGGSKPFRLPMYRYSDEKKKIIREQVEEMLRQGVIEPSTSPYNSPVVIARKKDSSPRFCVDFRRLNDLSEEVDSPLPLIYETIKDLGSAHIFSTIDLKSGYWQIPMEESSKRLTAFSVPDGGRYQFRVMPFGLMNAPSTFQRLMQDVLTGLLRQCCLVYLDDIVVYSRSWDEHLRHLDLVLERLQQHNLVASLEKCQFGRDQVSYLGHVITPTGNIPQTQHLRAITEHKAPESKKELQKFLGTCNWLREYIPRFAEVARPLTDLLAKKNWFWTEEAQQAFEAVRSAFSQPLKLSRPDPELPTVLQTDASQKGLGAVLYQTTAEGERRVISYASAKLTETEKKYHSNELECLALVWAIKKYRPYLEDRHFTLRTDNKALTWLKQASGQKTKYARWALLIQSFKFTLEHCPGRENELPDLLSREPEGEDTTQAREEDRLHPREQRQMAGSIAKPRLFEITSTPLFKLVSNAQDSDPLCQQLRQDPNSAAAYNLRVDENNILWTTRRSTGPYIRPPGVYAPFSVRQKIISHYHDAPEAGHPGAEETRRAIGRDYDWQGVASEVRQYIRQCRTCARYKRGPNPRTDQQRARKPTACWKHVAVDCMGPYPATERGNRFIIVATDLFSRWVEARPVPRTDTKTVFNFLEDEVFSRWGYPEALLTDNGTSLTSKLWKKLCRERHIAHWTVPVYHPRANPTERRNGEIKKTLRIALEKDMEHLTWDSSVPRVLFALRNRANAATGVPPSELLLGRPLKRPGDWQHPRAEEPILPVEQREQQAATRQNQYQRKKFDYGPEEAPAFAVGDRVFVRKHSGPSRRGRYAGFEALWEGPYKVLQRRGQVYEVDKKGSRLKAHLSRMKSAKHSTDAPDLPPTTDENSPAVNARLAGGELSRPQVIPDGAAAPVWAENEEAD